MIPILYDYAEKDFVTNGVGRLSDCISCVVTEERNGIYECEFEYPVDGAHFSEIKEGMIIACTHDDAGDIQPFDIYGHSAPINGVVTFYAHHVSYRLANAVVMPFTATSCVEAILAIPNNLANGSEFTYWTNKGTAGDYENKVPTNVRGLLGGQQNSILDVYGTGDYEFDKFMVRLYTNRGVDTGVQVRYGKNLIDLKDDLSEETSYNAVVPYWLSADGELVTLDEKLLVYNGAIYKTTYLTDHELVILRTESDEPIEVRYRVINAVPLDMSDAFEEAPTQEELRQAATSRFESSNAWLPSHNISIDFVQLWQTEEYKEYAPLQRVRLCDTVSVYYPKLGVEAVKEKVIKTVFNVLLDRYDSIELGTLQTTLAQAIKGDVESTLLEEVPKRSELEGMFDLIRGGLGGYVYLKPNAAGKPEEILIMDQPEINDAVNIIRMNKNGIGFSQNGYNGPFNSAWTIDGTFYADWIKAGIISDVAGKNSWNMDTGYLVTQILRAEEYIYMDGSEDAYFKIPFLSNTEHYLELSRLGFLIRSGDTYIENFLSTYSGTSGDILPETTVQVEGLRWVGEYDAAQYETSIHPFYFTMFKLPPGGGSAYYNTQLAPGSLIISNLQSSTRQTLQFTASTGYALIRGTGLRIEGYLQTTGTKNRVVETETYNERALYAYEMPSAMFGDIGEAVLDEEGICYVDIDDIFSETITSKVEYQVFLQKEGEGDCWIAEKKPGYFVIQGTPNLKVAWELKAKQKGYELSRMDQTDLDYDDYVFDPDDIAKYDDYILEQEELLNGSY